MGIRDRDYMKRPSDDDGPRGSSYSSSSTDSRAEEIARRFFEKYPRFFLYLGIGIGILIVAAVVFGKLS
jgi:uncharacterized MAPEG superfamily protein